MTKKAIIIDGNSLMFRAYYGTINQVDFFIKNNIEPTNAIKTMMLIIFKILETNKYDFAIIAFDHKDKNFRKQEFENYKATRKKTPEMLISQIEPIKNIMPYFGLNTYCVSGIEADDVVGSACKLLNDNNIFCDVYTSDNDMLQLVNKLTNVIQFKKGISETVVYSLENFCNLTEGLAPFQIPDFKGISGDSSDNLPGIKGIGPKTALNLLTKFKTLENIYENIDLIESKSIKQKFLDNKDIAMQCKSLATIMTNYFKNKSIDEFIKKPIDIKKIKNIIDEYKFHGFNRYIGEN